MTPFTPDLFYTTSFATAAVNYNYTVNSVRVGNTNSFFFTNDPASAFFFFPDLGRTPAASDPTNFPGIIDLRAKEIQCTAIQSARWGTSTTIPLPSGAHIGLYQPSHPTALNLHA